MEWGTDQDRVSATEVVARYDVSDSTLTRRRKAGQLPTAEKLGKRGQWTYTVADIEALAAAESWPSNDRSTPLTAQPTPDPDGIEIGQLRSDVERITADLDRVTAERDRSRSDLEQERTRADAAERSSIEHRTRADAVSEQRDDLAERLDKLTETLIARIEVLEATTASESTPEPAETLTALDTQPEPAPAVLDRAAGWFQRRRRRT